MKLKLDLHTHCGEATASPYVTEEIAKRIVKSIKAKGLNGIAITEHNDKTFGYKTKHIVENIYNGEVLIIPGQEVDVKLVQIVELYLPCDLTFSFLAHPGFPWWDVKFTEYIPYIQGIEIDNALHSDEIDRERVMAFAKKYDLLLLSNSDAHDLNDIGQRYNEVRMEELCERAQHAPPPLSNRSVSQLF